MAFPETSLPDEFVARLAELVAPEPVAPLLEALAAPRFACFRVNLLKTEPETVIRTLREHGITVQPWPHKPDALFAEPNQRRGILDSELYRDGFLYSQSLGSQLAALALEVRPGMRVLDMCAAPGGKTLQLACMMAGEGELIANEAVRKRFFKLRGVLAFQGAQFVRTMMSDGRILWRRFQDSFDAVLLDAPCSTEARMRPDEPASHAHWSPRKIREMRHKQKGLLRSAIRCVRPGGCVLYATCSFAPEENEGVIQDALRHFGDAIDIESVNIQGLPVMPGIRRWRKREFDARIQRAVRILPGPRSEAMFICRIRKHAAIG